MMTRPITQDSINISYPKTRPYDYIIVQKKHLRYRQYTGKKTSGFVFVAIYSSKEYIAA